MTSVIQANGQLAYEKYGLGNEILLAFHGFGQDRTIFKAWTEKLNSKYTIYAFDLFYHGDSNREPDKLRKQEWSQWISQFLEQESIHQFSVLGYSLGGRFAICTALQFCEKITSLTLIAPDGIFLTPWFKLATTPGVRIAFKLLMAHPSLLERLIRLNEQSKIVNQYVTDFARKEMGDLQNRKRVYRSWNHFKAIGYPESELISKLNQSGFQKTLIIGDKDQIILPKNILRIVRRIKEITVHRLPLKHHQLIKPEIADLIQ